MKVRIKISKYTIAFGLAFLGIIASRADLLEDAQSAISMKNYKGAIEFLERAVSENPDIENNGEYLYLSGVAHMESGDLGEAKRQLESAKSKGNAKASLALAKLAMMNYEFNKASNLYSQYIKTGNKSDSEAASRLHKAIGIAENALDRVQKIVIIDSISMPEEDFFAKYRLPVSAGRLLSTADLPFETSSEPGFMAYMNEGEDYLLWSETDENGKLKLKESHKLVGTGWQEPMGLPEEINIGEDFDFPFIMPDGITLYFAADGEESMGGYDIFKAHKDPTTGEYLQPLNIGMPFNSPADDFMLAVDEENGVGWWATRRNATLGKVNVYVYLLNELRQNHDPDSDDLIDYARIKNYRMGQEESQADNYKRILSSLPTPGKKKKLKKEEFTLNMGKGKVYHYFSDFKNKKAAEKMDEYLGLESTLKTEKDKLKKLRESYAKKGTAATKDEILKLEMNIERLQQDSDKMRKEVYKLEKSIK